VIRVIDTAVLDIRRNVDLLSSSIVTSDHLRLHTAATSALESVCTSRDDVPRLH
jgi:hypothetical protein